MHTTGGWGVCRSIDAIRIAKVKHLAIVTDVDLDKGCEVMIRCEQSHWIGCCAVDFCFSANVF